MPLFLWWVIGMGFPANKKRFFLFLIRITLVKLNQTLFNTDDDLHQCGRSTFFFFFFSFCCCCWMAAARQSE